VLFRLGDEVVEVTNTKRENNLPVHIVKKLPTDVTATFKAAINKEARMAISCNHSATHLLHAALREVLGTHVEQKGSQVDAKMLRFDFSHFQKMTPEEIRKVEAIANRNVRAAIERCEYRNMPIAEAKALGAMALFGEKYGDEVRVIKYGSSVELCGGTHVKNTGNIGMIKIISESSIAAGIRRIEAITGARVEKTMYEFEDTMKQISSLLNNTPNVIGALQKSIAENADLRKQAEEFLQERIKNLETELLAKAEKRNGITVVSCRGIRIAEVVRGVAFAVKAECPEDTVFVAATHEAGKPMLTLLISDNLVKDGLNASKVVREAAKLIQGGGGGQPHYAQAGGKNVDGLSAAVDKIIELIEL